MKFPKINTQSPTFIKLTTLFIVLLIIFIPKDSFKKLFSNGNRSVATAFSSSNPGNWNNLHTWGLNGGAIAVESPRGIAISSTTGAIYVTDYNHYRIAVLNPDGTASTSYNTDSNPTGIALSLTGEVYVANYYSSTINIYNPDGTASTTLSAPQHVNSIVFSPTGEIYLGVGGIRDDSFIRVLNPDGTASTTYSQHDPDYNFYYFASPTGIAFSQHRDLYIAMGINGGELAILNPNGTASSSVYSPGGIPTGVAVSPTGEIYVTDTSGNRIVVLNPDGTASTTYTGLGLNYPIGITLSLTGEIYIADTNNNRIVVLNPDGTASTTFNGSQLPVSFVSVEGIHYPGINDDITLSSGAPVTLTADQNVHNITFNSGSELDLNGHTLHVSGNWTNNGGTLTTNGGTIDLVGTTTQRILGENTFENLTKFASTSSSLLFEPDTLTTITGNLFLSGTSSNLLTLGLTGPLAPTFSEKLGNGKSGLYYPADIVFGPHGDIYVADQINNRIAVFNSDGTVLASYDGGSPTALYNIIAVALAQNGSIYAVNTNGGDSHVTVLNPDGTASTTYSLATFGSVQPSGIALSPTGEIYITDQAGGPNSTGCIHILNPDGTASTTYTIDSLQPLGYPSGDVVFAPSGEIYFTDSYNNRIVVLNPDGTASTTYSAGLYFPINLTFSSTGEIYVSDYGNNRIVVLNPDGTASTTYDGSGLSSGSLNHPHGIKFSQTADIYLVDYGGGTGRVVVLNPDGTASTTYAFAVPGGFSASWGIGRDSHGNIYVSDYGVNNIQKFDSSGSFIKTFDTLPAGIGQINSINVDNDGNVYVADRIYGNTFYKFDSDGYFIASTTIDNVYIYDQIAIDPVGNIYILGYLYDQGKSGVVKMDSNFNVVASTTEFDGLTISPVYGITYDPINELVYFFDGAYYRIIKLNLSDLSFISSISTTFDGLGSLYLYSAATDNEGNIIGITSSNNLVKISPTGDLINLFAGNGSDDGQFYSPHQMTVDSQNIIYVTDSHSAHSSPQKFTPSPFTPFNILATGSTTLSYLRVSGARNTNSTKLDCTSHCLNMGSNTGWMFPKPPKSVYSYPTIPNPYLPTTPPLPIVNENQIPLPPLPSPTPTPIPTLIPTPTPTVTFTKNLKPGDTDPQVKLLQQFLNSHGYPMATTGAGSPGHESTYFGSLTKAALIKFQNDHAEQILTPLHLTQGTGWFYTVTRNYVNSIL